MTQYQYGDPDSANVLIQMADDHDLSVMESEAAWIRELYGDDFCLTAWKVNSWNDDLSPWASTAVFGSEGFGGGAEETLAMLLGTVSRRDRNYYIGGYSLAGLFALWAAYQTDVFSGVAAASPSIWFPGFVDYMKANGIRTDSVYLSLGDREERTVGDCIRTASAHLQEKGIPCILEWNKGNHFKDADKRTAKAFVWVLSRQTGGFPG